MLLLRKYHSINLFHHNLVKTTVSSFTNYLYTKKSFGGCSTNMPSDYAPLVSYNCLL